MMRALTELLRLTPPSGSTTTPMVQFGGGLGSGGHGKIFFAKILEYDYVHLQYSWEEYPEDLVDRRTGTKAIDVYGGGVSLIGEVVLMIAGPDGVYRFCWDRPFEAELSQCDDSDIAKVFDPWDEESEIEVNRKAGWYAVGHRVLCVAASQIECDDEEKELKWTIADRLPMVRRVPLSGSGSGNSSNEAAPVQDGPAADGCDG